MMNDKPDIVNVIGLELELRKAGNSYKALCPFHDEKSASFIVSPSRQSFKCFGCNESGDVIEFIKKYKGCDFKGAISYLRMSPARNSSEQISNQIRKREAVQRFRWWCDTYFNHLCDKSRNLQQIKSKLKTMQGAEGYSSYYHEETTWAYHMDILLYGSDKEKLKLYEKVKK
jgi:DNA primase